MNLKTVTTTMALAVISSAANADFVCSAPTGVLSVRPTCKKTEKVVNPAVFGGAHGPVGPAGSQGPAGAQGPVGPAGVGVTNANCAQSDVAGVWNYDFITFGGSVPAGGGACNLSMDNNGNMILGYPGNLGGSVCGYFIGGVTYKAITSGKMSIVGDGLTCAYNFNYTLSDGTSWVGGVSMDRTRSNFSGLVSSNPAGASLITGVRLGAVNNGFNTKAQVARSAISDAISGSQSDYQGELAQALDQKAQALSSFGKAP